MDGILDFREILSRKPFKRILPFGYKGNAIVTSSDDISEVEDNPVWKIYSQGDFLREYYPSGHAINDQAQYPDILRKDEDGRYYEQPITRCSFAFQQVIATKHIVHLCGNDVQFELSDAPETEKQDESMNKMLGKFRKGWLTKGCEVKMYDCVRSLKITGECAIVGYMKGGTFGLKPLSYLNGDVLYPHFDSLTGDLILFARKYSDYDESGKVKTNWVEVWDDKNIYKARRDEGGVKATIGKFFGFAGYKVVDTKPHGFGRIPVAYHRDDDGPCWSNSQDTIEKYEESFSYLCENNKAFAFPIMYFKGDDVNIIGDMNGAVKSITMPEDGDAGFLNKQDASTSFSTQLDKLYKLIFEQSFAVIPPELKSGDLPGVAVKLLFSPAYEKATNDANDLSHFLSDLVEIVKEGYGVEAGCQTEMMALNINSWIEPYFHKSDTEITSNLAVAVQNGFLSRRTASERLPSFPKNDEIDRILREKKEEQEMDLLIDLRRTEGETDESIREMRAQAKMQQSGQDVNTGNGGSGGSGRQRHTDKWGNWEGENNWEGWNRHH